MCNNCKKAVNVDYLYNTVVAIILVPTKKKKKVQSGSITVVFFSFFWVGLLAGLCLDALTGFCEIILSIIRITLGNIIPGILINTQKKNTVPQAHRW